MRPVLAGRRPPLAAWLFAALMLAPMVWAWWALQQGAAAPAREMGMGWAMLVFALTAGLAAGPALAQGRLGPALIALLAIVVVLGLTVTMLATMAQALMPGFAVVLGLDLWAARAGLLPAWWPRLKAGFTVLAIALLLALGFM